MHVNVESLNCKLHLRLVILKMVMTSFWEDLWRRGRGFSMIRQRCLDFDCRCNRSPGLEQSVTPFTVWKQKPDMGWVLLVLGCNSEFRFLSGLAVWQHVWMSEWRGSPCLTHGVRIFSAIVWKAIICQSWDHITVCAIFVSLNYDRHARNLLSVFRTPYLEQFTKYYNGVQLRFCN